MLKRYLRSVLRRAKAWLAEEEHPALKGGTGHPPFSYEDANVAFGRLITDMKLERPAYIWGALQGVNLAKALGVDRTSILEFGVAGGNGLLALERIAAVLESEFAIRVDVYGFDVGSGLPKPRDHRDLPNLWLEHFYPMEQEKLQRRLIKADLRIGLVQETVSAFIDSSPAPVSFISFDLDHYTATVEAMKVLEADARILLPRVHCYFDDIMGLTFSDFTGERLAIAEFNQRSAHRKISPIHGLKYFLPDPHKRSMWTEMTFMAHAFDHPLYGVYDALVRETALDLRDDRLTG